MNTNNNMKNNNTPAKPHTHVVLCNKLKEAGFRVYVTYMRKIKKEIVYPDGFKRIVEETMPLQEIRANKLQHLVSARGGSLIAVAVKDNTVVAESEVRCSDRDNFRKSHGLTSAYGSLLSQLQRSGFLGGKAVDAK
jgi:hypothetical protein